MKRTIFILMMMILGVSVPSLAQQTVKEETNYIEHMITRGETFASIAKKYGITEQQLRDTNPKYKTAYAGLKLRVPQEQATVQAPTPQPSQSQQASISQQASSPQPDTQPKQIAERAPISGPPTIFGFSAGSASFTFDDLVITDLSGNILFEDHFTNNDGKWNLENGWSIENGSLICRSRSYEDMCTCNAYLGDDYDIQFHVKNLNGWDPFYFLLNIKDKKNYDYVNWGKIKLYKKQKGKDVFISLAKGKWTTYYEYVNKIRVSVRKGKIRMCSLNDIIFLPGEDAYKYYKNLAKAGNGEANFAMGILYGQGHIGETDLNKAIPYYQKAAEAGFIRGYYFTALCLEQNRNKDQANEWYMKAINKGDAMACLRMARINYESAKYDEAAKFIGQGIQMPYGIFEFCYQLNNKYNETFYNRFSRKKNDFSLKYPDVVYAQDYASYLLNPGEEWHPFWASAAKNHPLGCKKLAEVAEQGNVNAVKQYAIYLWTGEIKYIPQDKKKAIELCKRYLDEPLCQQLLIIAKGNGLYSGDVNIEWYDKRIDPLTKLKEQEAKNGNVEAAALLYKNYQQKYLTEMVESGNSRATQLMVELGVSSKEQAAALLSSAQKTKYDKYGKDINQLKSYYEKAYSIAAKGSFEKIDKSVIDEKEIKETMALYKEYPQYDKQNYRGKAQKLIDFLEVNSFAVEEAPSPKKFTGRASTGTFNTLFGITYPFFSSDAVNSWIGGYNSAIKTCQSKNPDPRFANFYKRALPILKRKKEIAEKNIEIARADYDKAVAKERTREYEQQTKGKAIDWDRCEEPSGDLCRDNLFNAILDVGNYTHKNNGIIRFKNGHRYKYNIIYDSNKRFSYYSVEHVSGEFKSKKEMIDAILKQER